MSVETVTCWSRFKACLCCSSNQQKDKKLTRKDANVDERIAHMMERTVDPLAIEAIRVQPKKHHFGKSTDIVTVLQCLKEERIGLENENKNSNKAPTGQPA